MTQRDEGHDYRDSKNKAQAYERKKITIIFFKIFPLKGRTAFLVVSTSGSSGIN